MEQSPDRIMNILPCGYVTTDKEGRIISVNKYMLKLLNLNKADIIREQFLQDFFPIGLKVYFETHISPLLRMQEAVEEISVELIRSDNIRIPVLLNALLTKNPEDGTETICFTFFDISQRKKYEQELILFAEKQKELLVQLQTSNKQIQKDNAYYKSIIENQSFYIIRTDLEGNYTYLNPNFCRAEGIRAEDWLGKSPLGLIMPEDHGLCMDTVGKCFADLDKTHWVTLRKISPSGILYTQWEFSIMRDENSNLTEFLCIGHDITQLMQKQENLQNLVDITALQNKRLNNFTHIVSHNIRSHVANLSGIISVTDMDDEEDRNQSFSILKQSVNALDETIHHLNEIISIQNNTNLPKCTLNVKEEIHKALQIIQLLQQATNATVDCNFADEECLETNLAYFESILLNLLTNAIKYRSPNRTPHVKISLYTEAYYKVLQVSDNGIGIDLNKYMDKIFGMYNTFHGNKDAKGLGLFITKTQIEALKGKIEVESKIDAGTTFKVYFYDK